MSRINNRKKTYKRKINKSKKSKKLNKQRNNRNNKKIKNVKQNGGEDNKNENNTNENNNTSQNNTNNKNESLIINEPLNTKTYYNSLSVEDKLNVKTGEGLYFIGVDIGSFIENLVDSFAQDNKNASKKDINIMESYGEYVDEDYNTVVKDVVGLRNKRRNIVLKPEDVIDNYSSLNNIITEAKKYKSPITEISPAGLLNMVQILSKYKKTYNQWYRTASLLETMYKYLGRNMKREDFFSSNVSIKINVLRDIEEFWKTDIIFMTPKMLEKFEEDLSFYDIKNKNNLL